jgi:phospholipase B1
MIFHYAVGLIHVDQIYQLTVNSSYCKPFQNSPFVVHDYECPCAHSLANQTTMAANVEFYNQALKSVYMTYAAQNFPNFGVAYQPLPVDIMSFPINAISNIGRRTLKRCSICHCLCPQFFFTQIVFIQP